MGKGCCRGRGGAASAGAGRGAAYISANGMGGLLIGGGSYGITPSSAFVPSFDLIAQEQSANSSYGGGYSSRQSYNPQAVNGLSRIYQSSTPRYQRTLDDHVNYTAANNGVGYTQKTIAESANSAAYTGIGKMNGYINGE
jgi:hypothetical protein